MAQDTKRCPAEAVARAGASSPSAPVGTSSEERLFLGLSALRCEQQRKRDSPPKKSHPTDGTADLRTKRKKHRRHPFELGVGVQVRASPDQRCPARARIGSAPAQAPAGVSVECRHLRPVIAIDYRPTPCVRNVVRDEEKCFPFLRFRSCGGAEAECAADFATWWPRSRAGLKVCRRMHRASWNSQVDASPMARRRARAHGKPHDIERSAQGWNCTSATGPAAQAWQPHPFCVKRPPRVGPFAPDLRLVPTRRNHPTPSATLLSHPRSPVKDSVWRSAALFAVSAFVSRAQSDARDCTE